MKRLLTTPKRTGANRTALRRAPQRVEVQDVV
jgi:hypothetical protein